MMQLLHQKCGNNYSNPFNLINKQSLDDLKSDIGYLKYEAESLHQVIEFVPYSEKPLDGASIVEIFLSIQTSQAQIVEILKDIVSKGTELDIASYELFTIIELSNNEIEEYSIGEIVDNIVLMRSQLIEIISDKTEAYFLVDLCNKEAKITVFNLLLSMVKEERALLKRIADLIMTYQTDRQFQREISKRPKG